MTDSVADLAALIRDSSKILVLVGAGISVNAGIPDFRSPGSGLYSQFEAEDVFSIDSFRSDPTPFYTMVSNLLFDSSYSRKKFYPTPTHNFFNILREKNKLLRVYSQNIDGLEIAAGLAKSDHLVQCHGSMDSVHCSECGRVPGNVSADEWFEAAATVVRKNSAITSILKCDYCGGFLKPAVVLFGESLPKQMATLLPKDVAACDLLLVLGTSLTVFPFATIPTMVPENVPRFVVTLRPGPIRFPVIDRDCDEVIIELKNLLDW